MKRKKVGRIIAIILLLGLILFGAYLSYIYFIGVTPEQRMEKKLTKMAKTFYEDYYYDLVSEEQDGNKDNISVYLSKYAKSGLKISLDSLKTYFDGNGGMNYTEFADCDENKTKIIITPKSPYGKTDYTVSFNLSCEPEKQ